MNSCINNLQRSEDELLAGSEALADEWLRLADASFLMRSQHDVYQRHVQNSALISYRTIISFFLKFRQARHRSDREMDDLWPADFLGSHWQPPRQLINEFDETVHVVNKYLAHLTWTRSTTGLGLNLQPRLYAAHLAMLAFVQDLPPEATWSEPLFRAAPEAHDLIRGLQGPRGNPRPSSASAPSPGLSQFEAWRP